MPRSYFPLFLLPLNVACLRYYSVYICCQVKLRKAKWSVVEENVCKYPVKRATSHTTQYVRLNFMACIETSCSVCCLCTHSLYWLTTPGALSVAFHKVEQVTANSLFTRLTLNEINLMFIHALFSSSDSHHQRRHCFFSYHKWSKESQLYSGVSCEGKRNDFCFMWRTVGTLCAIYDGNILSERSTGWLVVGNHPAFSSICWIGHVRVPDC